MGVMEGKEIKDLLGKQLQLLSERSARTKDRDYTELTELTKAMCKLAEVIHLFCSSSR